MGSVASFFRKAYPSAQPFTRGVGVAHGVIGEMRLSRRGPRADPFTKKVDMGGIMRGS